MTDMVAELRLKLETNEESSSKLKEENEKLLQYTEKAKIAISDYKNKLQQCVFKIKDLEADKKSILNNNKEISKDMSG